MIVSVREIARFTHDPLKNRCPVRKDADFTHGALKERLKLSDGEFVGARANPLLTAAGI